ncbi:bile acid:sodium symporter family protein [Patescibacteria group bacterium]
MKIFNIIRSITESHYLVIGLAFFVGIVYAESVVFLSGYSTLILATIFFLSSLKINLKEVKEYLTDKWMIILSNVFMLFLLPVFVYFTVDYFWPSLSIAFLLLAAMPAGMTAPLLSEISGGRQSLALVITITTSLLAPITVPLVVKFLAGASVDVSMIDMFILLATVIYIPFILAQFVKNFWQNKIDKISGIFKPMSVILLGLLIMVIVAKQSDVIVEGFNIGGEFTVYLLLLFVFFLLLHFLGYFIMFWKSRRDKITITVCLTYMNFTLAIELANKFFDEPNIIIPVVFSVIPWAIMFIPFRAYSRSHRKSKK